jgi:murein L,D-transpeptidase YafK
VRTDEGTTGYVADTALSNVWIRVSKAERHVYVYEGTELAYTFKADMAYNSFSDKQRNGSEDRPDHWRTPEGTFYVVHKNPQSEFYKALVLNYPKVEDARRGLEAGLISRSQYEAIRQAQDEHRMPPMETDLGGWIEIHGDGTGAATAWTRGCVAIRNAAMDAIWEQVRVGTPVLVE